MSSTPRHPIRLSVYTTDGVYYPREITEADGKLYLIDDDGTVVELNKTAVTKITDAAGTSIGSVDPSTGGTVAIPNASTSKRGLVVFGTSTGKAPGTASAGSSDSVARADHVHPKQSDVSGNAGTATKLAAAVKIGLSGVTATAQDFDGSTDVTIPITAVPASIVTGLATVATSGAYSDLSGRPTIYQPATTAPKAPASSAAVGTGTTFARADHVHPVQTAISGNAGSATKLATARTFALSGVTASSVDFDGTDNVTIEITAVPASIVTGLAAVATSGKYSDLSGLPTIYQPSTATPKALGTAAVGTATTFARADHVHQAPTSVSGNAGTATKLANARTITVSGVTATGASFDGSDDATITITAVPASIVTGLATVATSGAYSDLSGRPTIYQPGTATPKVASGSGAVGTGTTFARADHVHPVQSSVSGNAGTATKLAAAKSIILSGGATGSASFDGSADATINVTALDGSKITGTIPLSAIPKGAQERLIVVADDTARLALTSSGAQNGDVVKVESTGIMYYVVDDSALGSEDAFSVFTAGAASSVDWSGITNKPTSFTPSSHNHSASNITSGTLGVARGGTGTTTFTSGAVLIGNGTGAIQTRAIDTTSGGTADSTSLITSGAVAAGLAGKANSSHGTHVTYGTSAPKVASSSGSAGSASSVSRSDHVHPAQTTVSGNAGSATKLANARTIGLSGVTATGASFDGSADVTIEITAVPASIVTGLATVATSGKYSDLSGLPTIPSASSTTPVVAGTAAVGTATTFARADHVHPAQTTVSGNAGSATKLANSRTFNLSGVTTAGGVSFNGTGNVTIEITAVPASIVSGLATVATSGAYSDLSGRPTIYQPSSTTPVVAGTAAVGTATTFARADHVHPAQTTVSGNAGSATKVNNSIIIKLNGGSTEGTNLFTFNGSAAKTINITPSAIGAAASSHGTHVTYGTDAAAALASSGSAGSASSVSRSDHVHPLPSLSALGAASSGHTHSYAGSSSAGGAANSVANSIIIKLNGGSTEGTNLFTFNGSAAKTINITPSAIGAAASSHGTHVTYGTSSPVVAGTASAGSASSVSRSDHVHPAQTTVSGNAGSASKVNNSIIIKLNGGTTEGTNLFTFNGSAAKTIDITPSAIGAAASSHGTHVSFTTTKPVVAGTAAVGSATTVSRSDHVHPAQTSVSGNAGTATKFASAQSVALTGDVTGSASSQAGWSVSTTLASTGVTAGSYGPSADATPAHSGTFSVPYITVDAKGRVTGAATRTITLPADNNTTYTPPKLGFGRGTCSTAYATTAKVVSLSNYTLVTGGYVSVQFTYGVPAGATLNVNSKGAKAIYHGTAAITDGVIKAGDCATFVYNGSYYYLVSIDRPSNTYTASIGTSWTGSAAPYTQTITVSGMSANDNPIVDIVPDSDYDTAVEQMYEYNKIYRITTALNSITVYATEPTEVAIPIQLKCVKA